MTLLRQWGPPIAFAAAACLAVIPDAYFLHVATLFLLYAMLAMGLSVVVGFAGLLDVGYVAFFAIGAYFYAILGTKYGLPFPVALVLAPLLAALAGVLLGLPTLRVRGDYLAIVTLAFGEMVRQLLQNWTQVTGGTKGIIGVPSPRIFPGRVLGAPWQYYLLVLACTFAIVLVMRKLARSPIARIWEAIRDEETAARSCGINVTRWLLLAFGIGAFVAGFAGVHFAAIQRFVSPETFVLEQSILILSIVVLARGKSIPRIFIATAVLYGLPELLRPVQQYRTLAFGVLLIGITIFDYRLRRTKPISMHVETPGTRLVLPGPAALHDLRPADGAATFLAVDGVEKSFSGLQALAGVQLRVDLTKRVVALVGSNGAGKTTLFNCISGLETVDRGTIEIGGVGLATGRPAHVLAQVGIARTFQRVRLFPSMTVEANVEIGALGVSRVPIVSSLVPGLSHSAFDRQVGDRVRSALQLVGIESFRGELAAALPIGLQRKVELARALAMRPRLLLLDEAASGLNDSEKLALSEILRAIAFDGEIPIVLVEHDLSFVAGVANHVVAMEAGAVLCEGELADVLANPDVMDAYLGVGGGSVAVVA